MAENIITLIVLVWTAFIMIIVGIFQLKCKHPVGFYTFEKPLKEEQVSDVTIWNKKHGMMWIAYGVGMLLSYLLGCLIENKGFSYIVLLAVTLGAIPVMIVYHHWLKKKYVK